MPPMAPPSHASHSRHRETSLYWGDPELQVPCNILPSWWPQFSWKDWIYRFYHDDGFLAVSPYHPTTAMRLDWCLHAILAPVATKFHRSPPLPTVAPGTPGVSGPCSARHRLPSWWLRQASPPDSRLHGKFPNSNHLYICNNYVYIYVYIYIEREIHISWCVYICIYRGLSHG